MSGRGKGGVCINECGQDWIDIVCILDTFKRVQSSGDKAVLSRDEVSHIIMMIFILYVCSFSRLLWMLKCILLKI